MSEYDFLKIFESIIDEADVSDQESAEQDSVSRDLSHHKASKTKKKKDTIKDKRDKKNVELDLEEDEIESSGDTSDSQESNEKIKISTEFSDFIKAANAFRATRSLRDKDVKGDLSAYFKGLSTGEKESLYVFFKGLTQIAGSDVDGDQAPAPQDFGIKTTSKTKAQKPATKPESQETEEKDLSSSNPITVGESIQDKSEVLSLLYEINNK